LAKLNKSSILDISIQLFKLLTKKRKRQIFLLLIVIVISGFAEIFSIGALLPFLELLTNPDKVFNFNFLSPFFSSIAYQQKLIILGIAFISLNFLSSFIRVFNLYLSNMLAAKIGLEISYKSFEKTIYQRYKYHINSNSSEIISTITVNIGQAITTIATLLQFISSSIFCVAIIITLMAISWKITVISFAFIGSTYYFIVFLSKNKISRNSSIKTQKVQDQFKILQEGLGLIREIILSNNQENYLSIYKRTDEQIRYADFQNNFLITFPKFVIEFVTIALLSVISLFLVLNSTKTFVNFIPSIGAFALGTQRLLIYFQLCYASLGSIRSRSSQLETVLTAVNRLKTIPKIDKKLQNIEQFRFSNEIKFIDVSFKYKSSMPYIFKNLNLNIKRGDVIGIKGLTGSGKSTFVDLFAGLLQPTSGEILVDEHNLYSPDAKDMYLRWQYSLAYVPQETFLFDDSIASNIVFGTSEKKINKERLINALKISQAFDFVNRLPLGYMTRIGEKGVQLSGGQRQRINIARALYKNRKTIILDESTSSLDVDTEKKVLDSIMKYKKDCTIIMITHRPRTLNFCNRIFEIKSGNLLEI